MTISRNRLALLLASLLVSACANHASRPAPDAGLLDATTDAGRLRADSQDVGTAPGRLMWFGPHPDDEFYVAPMLGHYCRDSGWQCTMVVFTQGEGGSCGLPQGCIPDLRAVRTGEVQTSAKALGAELELWDLGDNGRYQPYAGDVQEVLESWAARSGGLPALIDRVVAVIVKRNPTLVLAVDPRHGNYCHPTHRAAGALVVQAIDQIGDAAPELHLIVSRAATRAEGLGFLPVVPADPTLKFFDATVPSASLGGEAWGFYVEVLRTHRSQFALTEAQLALLLTVDPTHKRVYFINRAQATKNDPLYDDPCPPSTFLK